LKEGEAESYTGVTVRFVPGREAILTIYEDGVEVEQVPMFPLEEQGKEAMHALLLEKGFVRTPPEEMERLKQAELQEALRKEEEDRARVTEYLRRAQERGERLAVDQNSAASNSTEEQQQQELQPPPPPPPTDQEEQDPMVTQVEPEAAVAEQQQPPAKAEAPPAESETVVQEGGPVVIEPEAATTGIAEQPADVAAVDEPASPEAQQQEEQAAPQPASVQEEIVTAVAAEAPQ